MSDLGRLGSLPVGELHAEWRRMYRTLPPRISRDLIVRALAHRMQERTHGRLPEAERRRLRKLAATAFDRSGTAGGANQGTAHGAAGDDSYKGNATRVLPAAVSLAPGTRLVREWGGRTHTVEVATAPSGSHNSIGIPPTSIVFVHDGRTYGSLSEVARAITGARWSGPRFFGLVRRKSVSTEQEDGAPAAAAATATPTEAMAP